MGGGTLADDLADRNPGKRILVVDAGSFVYPTHVYNISRIPNGAVANHFGVQSSRNGRKLTPACDLYALGVILYEAVAGYHPLLNWRRGPVACPFPNPKDPRGLAAAVSAFRNAVTPVRDKVHSQPWLNGIAQSKLSRSWG